MPDAISNTLAVQSATTRLGAARRFCRSEVSPHQVEVPPSTATRIRKIGPSRFEGSKERRRPLATIAVTVIPAIAQAKMRPARRWARPPFLLNIGTHIDTSATVPQSTWIIVIAAWTPCTAGDVSDLSLRLHANKLSLLSPRRRAAGCPALHEPRRAGDPGRRRRRTPR